MMGDNTEHPIVFRYTFLRQLGQELYQTQTWQKVTLFHFLYLAMPIWGIAAGIAWNRPASLGRTIIGGTFGCAIGSLGALFFPRLLWAMLSIFARRKWFIQSEIAACPSPSITRAEYMARMSTFRREENFLVTGHLVVAFGGIWAIACLAENIEWASDRPWLMILVCLFLTGTLFCKPWRSWLVERNGVHCPGCRQFLETTEEGNCIHCGGHVIGKVIQVPNQIKLMTENEFQTKIRKLSGTYALSLLPIVLIMSGGMTLLNRFRGQMGSGKEFFILVLIIAAGITLLQTDVIGAWLRNRAGLICPSCQRGLAVTGAGDCAYCLVKIVARKEDAG